jgi:hypothetical protein
MTGRTDIERLLDAFLAPEGDVLADRVYEAALGEIARTEQRRALRAPWRFTHMPVNMRLAAVAAIVVIAAVGALLVAAGRMNPPPIATQGPTVSPTTGPTPTIAAVDTTGWVRFTSDRYGYSMSHPPDWEVNPGSRDWYMEADRTDWLSPAQDQFIDEQAAYQIGVHGFGVDLPADTLPDDWIDAFFAGTTEESGCLIRAAEMPEIVIGSRPGKLADQPKCSDSIAFVFQAPRMYVFTIGRENQLPLFLGFLSTVQLNPDITGLPYTGDWTSYISVRYGFQMAYPPGWSAVPAAHAWSWERDAANWLTTAHDAFTAPGDAIRVSAWEVPLDAEIDQSWAAHEAWATEYCGRSGEAPCTGIHDRIVPMCIEKRDCHGSVIVPFDEDVLFFGHGGVLPEGMTVVAVWRPEADPSVAPYGGSTRLLEAFLSTMDVWQPFYPESQQAAAQFLATGE